MRFRLQTAWISLLTIFLVTPALAGGLYVTEFGHPLQGASGAGAAALAQDASTAFTNPAGIMMLEESEWMVTGMAIVSEIEFEQDTSGTTVSGNNGGDAGGFAPGAALFYANPFNDSFGFGFSFNAISAAIMDYDSGFVGRYWAEEVEILVVTALPSIAYRVNDQWSVSLGIPISYGQLDMDVAIPPLFPGGTDGQAKINDGDDFVATLSAGVLWEVSDRFRLGLTYFGELDFEFDSDVDITLPPGGGVPLPQIRADVELPLVQTLRMSASSDIGDNLTVLASVDWEDWSSMDSILITTDSGAGGQLARNWDDTWGFKLGMRWRTGGPWVFHTGIAYDTDPSDPQDRTADMPIDRQIRLSGGANYEFSGGTNLGGVLTYADYGDAEIDNGGDWGQVVGEYDKNRILFIGINYGW